MATEVPNFASSQAARQRAAMPVIQVAYAWPILAHDSFTEAVVAGQKNGGTRTDEQLVNDQVVEGYAFYGDRLSLRFSNDKYLHIFPGVNRVDWYVSAEPTLNRAPLESEQVTFQFPDRSAMDWSWKTILDGFIGRQAAISPSEQWVFIFYRGGVEYMINVLQDASDRQRSYLLISEC